MLLKNKNIIFKIRRSKVTDYAALKTLLYNINNTKQHINTSTKALYKRDSEIRHVMSLFHSPELLAFMVSEKIFTGFFFFFIKSLWMQMT